MADLQCFWYGFNFSYLHYISPSSLFSVSSHIINCLDSVLHQRQSSPLVTNADAPCQWRACQ